ncbi:beta strand repeat-containing protein [Maribacter sp. R86514]|uniref:beta strand repeat-containing protein n=1 Tax=Maribacter sp. R86514 TaxID=3093854 RepID=UPI0037C94FD6
MSSKIKLLLFFILFSFCVNAQVKIGENPNSIDPASIVELESTNKAFVLTRLTTAQMQAMAPLNGALVYNIDTQCVHYYNGVVWTNLCDGLNNPIFTFEDNGNGTITLSDGNGNDITFDGASQIISTLEDNGDSTYTYTNENGIETNFSIVNTDNQNLQTDSTPGNISIDNGNAITINVEDADADDQNEIQTLEYTSGVLTLSNDPNATTVDLSGFDQNAADDFSGSFNDLTDLPVNLDTDATDDFNTGISFDGTNLTVTDAGGDVSTNISGLAYDDTAIRADIDQNELDADNAIAAVDTKIDNHIIADEDVSATNELSDLSLDASNILTLTNPATGTNEVDLSGYVSTDDQNLESATLSSDSELGINIEGGEDVTVDLSALEESDDITAVQNDVDQNEVDADNAIAAVDTKIDNHIIADEDVSATNELSDLSLDASNILTLTNPATGTNEVDLSGYVSTDDQNLESATLSSDSELGINIEGGEDVTVDLSALEESDDITAVQDDVDQNEVDADNAIAAVDTKIDNHIIADEDVSATNELSDLSLDASNILTLTNPATGTNEVDLSGYVSTDDQNLESATLSSDSELGINIEGGEDVTVDLSALEESDDITAVQNDVDQNEVDADNAIAAVDTKIDNHIIADEDVSATNELSDLSLDASNILTLTNPATGTNEVDLSGYVSTDDQNLESATLSSDSELGINIEGGEDVTVDLSALEESDDITAVQNDVDQNELDADNAIAAVDTKIDNHIIADEDVSATNELSDLSLDASNILTLTNPATGTNEVDLSGYVSTDDQNLESATLSSDSELGINIEGGEDVTVDLSALEESDDITAVQDDVDQNELDADNAIAAVDSKIDNHIIADEDVSATNELSDLSLDASNILTLTNPATGTNEVDLSGYVSTDDQNLESATLSSDSELGINIEGGEDVTVDLSALEESDDITAVQNDVDQNEVDADNAIAAVDTKIDNHIIADEDVSATNELSDLSLDASNILTLTNPATGTNEVDLSGYVSTDDQNLESATLSSDSELGINIEGGEDVTVDLSALEESDDITAVQDDVDQNEVDADNAIAAVDTKIDNHIIADEDISATNELSDLNLDATSNILTLTNAEAGATGVNLSGYKLTGTTGSIFFADTDGTPTEENSELFWNNSSNSLGIGTNTPSNKLHVSGAIRSQGILNSNGTVGEPSYRFSNDPNTGMYRPAADEISFSVGGIEALKVEETSNNTSVIVNETLELEGAVLDENDSAGTAGQVLTSTATGTEWVDNFNPVKAIGKISSTGTITKASTGVAVTRISIGYYRVTLPAGSVSDADYIIQLTQPGRAGAGNDDPGISYANQTATSFEVIIGDNDNGGTDRSRFDSEFMFTVLDL